ncbi:MAG TPA: helix-turn-helix transcriptional regulator [Tepidisphaeraceae bacterium]
MARKSKTLVDQIRRAVDDCGMSRYALGQLIGMDKAQMSRFMAGKGFLSEDSMNRLAESLHLSISSGAKPKAAKTKDR